MMWPLEPNRSCSIHRKYPAGAKPTGVSKPTQKKPSKPVSSSKRSNDDESPPETSSFKPVSASKRSRDDENSLETVKKKKRLCQDQPEYADLDGDSDDDTIEAVEYTRASASHSRTDDAQRPSAVSTST